jgi:SHS2 domain-containing protein
LALKETITRNVKIASKIKKEINVEGKDSESLLYNFLEEFLFLLDSESFIFSRIENLNISKNKLNAVVYGDKMENYGFTNDVKAITYSEMKIKKNNLGYSIVGVFDV